MSNDTKLTPDPISVIAMARWYVYNFEPRTAEEDEEQKSLLAVIDRIVPPEPPIEYCSLVETCCLVNDHPGECCDIPF